RDTGVVLQGGVVICRMGPVGRAPGTGRRGEEAFVTRRLAALGMPILRTIHGSGLFEGGSFTLLNQTAAAAGLSYRQNEEAARRTTGCRSGLSTPRMASRTAAASTARRSPSSASGIRGSPLAAAAGGPTGALAQFSARPPTSSSRTRAIREHGIPLGPAVVPS